MTSESELRPELGTRLSYLLKRAFLELEDLHTEQLAPFGLNLRELTVLMLLAGHEPESQQQAATRLGVDRTTMVGLLDALESKGLVARQPDPEDRRRNVVVLTGAGRRVLPKAKAASDRAEARLLDDLSEADAGRLRRLLGGVATAQPRDRATSDAAELRH